MTDLINMDISRVSQIEKICRDHFRIGLRIVKVALDDVPTSKGSHTTIFQTDRNAIYALCMSDDPLILADVKSIVRLMGMTAESYFPPNADKNYFIHFGQKTFQSVFPGRKAGTDQEISYYKTLAPYSPALIRIARIDGEIRQYDKLWQQWQSALEFSYQRMQVQ